MKRQTRVYHPALTWKDAMTGFIAFARERGLNFDELNPDELDKAVAAQSTEGAEDERLERVQKEYHHDFVRKQAERFAQFMRALELARAKYRDDSKATESLDRFKRVMKKHIQETEKEAPETPEAKA